MLIAYAARECPADIAHGAELAYVARQHPEPAGSRLALEAQVVGAAIALRDRYALSGTEIAYGAATRFCGRPSMRVASYCMVLRVYALS
eukprot:3941248-Rhodomonas_salina.4